MRRPNKALQLTSASRGVPGQRRSLLASLAGRLEASGGSARRATVLGQRRSQLSADPLAGCCTDGSREGEFQMRGHR